MHPQLSQAPNYTVWATVREVYGLDAATFQFQAVGFNDDILQSAFSRYAAIVFGYGPGAGAPGTIIPGLKVRVKR
jgi:hypothetical protein